MTGLRFPPPLLDAALAGGLGALVAWAGPDGTDFPAHLLQVEAFRQHGFELWSNAWYAGHPTLVGYSVLYYPLAALVGIKPLAVASAMLAAAAFTALLGRTFASRTLAAGHAFALLAAVSIVTAAFPYALGLALALAALVALDASLAAFAALTLLAYAASPLAFLFEALVLVAAGLGRTRRGVVRPAVVVVAVAAVAVATARLFPDEGRYPFQPSEVVSVVVFCLAGAALTWRVEAAAVLARFFVVYAAACLVSAALPSDLGGNVARLRLVAVPIALLVGALRQWQPFPVLAAALVLATVWNATPLVYDLSRSASDPSAARAYWQPVIGFLTHSLTPAYRVEVVATADHWEAYYLPQAGIPIARGWFRQDDYPQNALLYRSRLTRAGYLAWLRRLGVRYVVLTDAVLDYSSRAEAALLRSGRAGLRVVFRARQATVYAVPDPSAIVTGPDAPRVLADGDESITLLLRRPGTYEVALRYSPYLTAPESCIGRADDGMVRLTARVAGRVQLGFVLSTRGALAALRGDDTVCTPGRQPAVAPGA